MKSILKEHAGFIIIASLFFSLGILRLNDLSLNTDCTRYLIWGNSVAHGKGFIDDTQPEPEYYVFNAPFFSIILAPALLFFPLSLTAAKVWTLLLGVLALLLFYRWLRNNLGQVPALAATLFLALSPLTLIVSTEVFSETSFLCAVFGIILLIDRIERHEHQRWVQVLLIVILSFIMLLREIGIALLVAALVFLFFRKRKFVALMSAITALLFFALWNYYNLGMLGTLSSSQRSNLFFVFQHFVTPPETTLIHELTQRLIINFKTYSAGLGGMLLYLFPSNLMAKPWMVLQFFIPFINILKYCAAFVILPSFIIGIIYDIRHSHTALLRLLFLFIYLSIILIYPVKDIRFLFPFLPFMIYYTVISFTEAYKHLRFTTLTRSTVTYTIVFILIFPNIIYVFEIIRTNLAYRKDPVAFSSQQASLSQHTGYFSTPWKILGERIDREIPASSIMASPDKEIVPFAPRHKFLELNRAVTLPRFETLLRDYTVEYLLAPTVYDSLVEFQNMIDESKRFRFEHLYRLNRNNIFRIKSRLEEQTSASSMELCSSALNNLSDTIRFGRFAFMHEKYPEALSIFSQLRSRYPHRTDILYQLLLIHTFMPDSASAMQDLRELYTSPNSTSYTAPAQVHMYAMRSLLRAQSMSDSVQCAEQLLELGRLYWNLGYSQQAYHMMRHSVELNTQYFVGYLWAWHYGIQVGDTISAKEYLKKLEYIDRDNPIVTGFKVMTACFENLRQTNNHQKRSELHLTLSREYNTIDLHDEALDEAQRAIGEDSKNAEAWRYLAHLFEKKNSPLAVKRALQKASELETTPSPNSGMPQKK
jgi:tetratricopeptide (TPR) repeat protein